MVDRSKPEVAVLHKALSVLEALADSDGTGLSVADLSTESQVTRSAVYRVLNTLEARGYVTREVSDLAGGRMYRLGPAVEGLARGLRGPNGLLARCAPTLRRLWREFGETVNLGVLHDDQVVYVEILESDQGLRTSARQGSRHPIHATALGKALLAGLPRSEARGILQRTNLVRLTPATLNTLPELLRDLEEIEQRGYAIDDEENEVGARCIAVAILDGDGAPVAAISVSAPTWRMPTAVTDRIARRLLEEVRTLEPLTH